MLGYITRNWADLEVFPTDGRVEIDSNADENKIRPLAPEVVQWPLRHPDLLRRPTRSWRRGPPCTKNEPGPPDRGRPPELREIAEVLDGCCEMELILGAVWPSEAEAVEADDALEVCKQHLDLLPGVARRDIRIRSWRAVWKSMVCRGSRGYSAVWPAR